jgi:hypothetical protein
MDFKIRCNLPLPTGRTVEEYEQGLSGFKLFDSSDIGSFHAKVIVEDQERFIKGSVRNGVIVDVELIDLRPHDTFEGVSVSLRPRKFAKQLTKSGFPASLDDDGVILIDCPVSMYVEEKEVASICWEIDD